MQKLYYLLGLMLLIQLSAFMPAPTKNQLLSFNSAYLTGKNWKVDQLYLDSIRAFDNSFTSGRFTFTSDGKLTTTNGSQSLVRLWQANATQNQIIIKNINTNVTEQVYSVLFLDASRFIYKVTVADSKTGKPVTMEVRLIAFTGS
ncbi:MAG: hypothetical protein V4714_16220 [Bacteroidota bacterium]